MKSDAVRLNSPRQDFKRRRLFLRAAPGLLVLAVLSGCGHHQKPDMAAINATWHGPTTNHLSDPVYDRDVVAVCDPPIGWKPDPLKTSASHKHQVWLSPTGATAYGVIHFTMPLPVGEGIALSGFLDEMKKTEGQAILLKRQDDPNLPGIRFVAEGGLYQIRTNLIVDGWDGWAVYAGTLRKDPVNAEELDMAVRAREHTRVGEPDTSGK